MKSSVPSGILPIEEDLSQEEVQKRLASLIGQSEGMISPALECLEQWSRGRGYFAHLTQPNLYLEAADHEFGVSFRLQVNYSRLGYKPAERLPGQPANPLAWENVASPWKPLLRAIEFECDQTPYFAHPTPFPLHPGHFVLNVRRQEPMRMSERSLREMASFLRRAPGWLAASNSDVAWAGASVLEHQHFQLFQGLQLPVEKARSIAGQELHHTMVDWLHWPAPTARITGSEQDVVRIGGRLISRWKATDPGKSTCNLLLRLNAGEATATVFLRHPGFRTPEDLRGIKSEGVGIVEMAGEVIVPPIPEKAPDENRDYFSVHLTEIARGIIGGNGPRVSLRECEGLVSGA